jgi:hypothetical protein
MKLLAPYGRDLYRLLLTQAERAVPVAGDNSRIISIARPTTVHFTLPWTYVYQIPVQEGDPVCRLVADWDGSWPLVKPGTRSCPHRADAAHRNGVYCPFGFWGLGQTLEAPPTMSDTEQTIDLHGRPRIVIGETQVDVVPATVDAHVARLRKAFVRRAGSATVERRTSRDAILKALSRDLPIVYFLCHGYKPSDTSPETWLGFGREDFMTVAQFVDMTDRQRNQRKPKVWSAIRPLVLINACHSLDIEPGTLLSYVDTFVGYANARCVIGTEVKVPQDAAMEWAELFFNEFLRDGATAASALAMARSSFLARGSLFGLVYTAHCWAHLKVA